MYLSDLMSECLAVVCPFSFLDLCSQIVCAASYGAHMLCVEEARGKGVNRV